MKHFKVAGLCLVAMFAMSMAATVTASAAPVWEQCREGTGNTKYEDSHCTKLSTSGKFQWQEVKGTEKVNSSATLTLKDTNVPIVGTVEVKCSGTDEGTIGPGKFDKVTKIVVSKCTAGTNCSTFKKAEARNLPWQTELFETEGRVRNKITSGGAGAPGWAVTCVVLIVEETDVCTTETGSTLMEPTLPSGALAAVFEAKSGKANCTVGGTAAGEVGGIDTNVENEVGTAAIKVS